MAFVSSPSSTNKVNTAYRVNTTNTQVSPASTQVSTASTQVSTANLIDATVYAFLASQPNGSQRVHEDLVQIHEDNLEEMDLKWQLALLGMRTRKFFQKTGRKITINRSDTVGYDKSKVECFNYHKLGHFARECRQPRNQDSRNMNQDSSRRTVDVEETGSNAMVAIDGAGFDWSYMADDEVPTNMALMAFSDSEHKFEGYGPKTSNSVREDISNKVKESPDAPLVKELMSNDKLEKKTVFPTVAKIEFVRPKQQEKLVRKPVKLKAVNTARPNSVVVSDVRENQLELQEKGVINSGCSRHMTKNMSYLLEYEEIDGGYVAFGGDPKGGKITGKGKISTDPLRKFDGKADEGFFVGYFVNSKAFRVFNSRTRIVDETLHITFLENKPNVRGSRPTWLFDIDTLTKSMNYKPVTQDILFSSSSKDSPGAGCKPSREEEKKDAEGPGNIDKDNVVDENIVYECGDDPNMPNLEEIVYPDDEEEDGAEADMTNLDTNIPVSHILTTRIHKDHQFEKIIGDIHSTPQTRRMTNNVTNLVARIEAIRLFLAYASFKDFVVYQMNVKNAFLYGRIKKEVYVCQPLGFEDPKFPDRVYKVEKALYGLHQAPRAWYETLSTYLLDNGFHRGKEMCNEFEKMMHKKF
nr:putative ribonuclease H-like domain-containing protein [Tanacetum cinerariifolium]